MVSPKPPLYRTAAVSPSTRIHYEHIHSNGIFAHVSTVYMFSLDLKLPIPYT